MITVLINIFEMLLDIYINIKKKIRNTYIKTKYACFENDILYYSIYNKNILYILNYDKWYYLLMIIIIDKFLHFNYFNLINYRHLSFKDEEIIICHYVSHGELKKIIFNINGYKNFLDDNLPKHHHEFLLVNLQFFNNIYKKYEKYLNKSIDLTPRFHEYNTSFYLGNNITCKDWILMLFDNKSDHQEWDKIFIIRDTDFEEYTFKEYDLIEFKKNE